MVRIVNEGSERTKTTKTTKKTKNDEKKRQYHLISAILRFGVI